ncbi:hypothetical protein [Burkholderia sp. Bp8963]|uniref:hypothetical protein n=1 Tax=Burkholderia sp. Bp8963 TaxID=2184547 RepID=UPI0021AB7343|nr:hypothetical protein [Burkholderia sp. Bp8963]
MRSWLRKEYPLAAPIVSQALQQAHATGWQGSGFDLQWIGRQGAYICGKETSLLNALEGRRSESRQRPPQITGYGLFGAPTLVHNMETLCSAPSIAMHGAAAYAGLGLSRSRGTKLGSACPQASVIRSSRSRRRPDAGADCMLPHAVRGGVGTSRADNACLRCRSTLQNL